jgi:hypothetical protein
MVNLEMDLGGYKKNLEQTAQAAQCLLPWAFPWHRALESAAQTGSEVPIGIPLRVTSCNLLYRMSEKVLHRVTCYIG